MTAPGSFMELWEALTDSHSCSMVRQLDDGWRIQPAVRWEQAQAVVVGGARVLEEFANSAWCRKYGLRLMIPSSSLVQGSSSSISFPWQECRQLLPTFKTLMNSTSSPTPSPSPSLSPSPSTQTPLFTKSCSSPLRKQQRIRSENKRRAAFSNAFIELSALCSIPHGTQMQILQVVVQRIRDLDSDSARTLDIVTNTMTHTHRTP